MDDLFTFKTQFNSLIDKSQTILITSHLNPDDDSISSVLFLKFYLNSKFPDKKIILAYESKISSRWSVFEGFDQIKSEANLEVLLNKSDCLISLDANQYHRMTHNPSVFEKFLGNKICIDHHKSNADDWNLTYIDTNSSSNAQILYKLFYEPQNTQSAKLLLLGILGDTGNLRYINYKQVDVFDAVKNLVTDAKIDIQSFKSSYDYFSKEAMIVAKNIITNQQIIKINNWPTLSLAFVDKPLSQDYQEQFIKEGVSLYISSFSLLVKEVTWSLTFYPVYDGVKVSGRSISESVNVRKLFESMNIGSGHDRASGGKFTSTKEVENAVSEMILYLENNSPIFD